MDLVMVRTAIALSKESLAQQIEAIARNHARLERLLRLGVAALAGSLAIAGLVQQAGVAVDAAGATAFAAGFVLQVVGVGIGSLGHHGSEITSGPDPAGIYAGLADEWGEIDLLVSSMEEISLAFRRNRAAGASLNDRAGFVLGAMFTGTATVLVATAYLVGGAILG